MHQSVLLSKSTINSDLKASCNNKNNNPIIILDLKETTNYNNDNSNATINQPKIG